MKGKYRRAYDRGYTDGRNGEEFDRRYAFMERSAEAYDEGFRKGAAKSERVGFPATSEKGMLRDPVYAQLRYTVDRHGVKRAFHGGGGYPRAIEIPHNGFWPSFATPAGP